MNVPKSLRVWRLLLIGSFIFSSLAYPYDINTHMDISQSAAEQSSFSRYLPSMGLVTLKQKLSDGLLNFPTNQSIVDWIRTGARREDDFFSGQFIRFTNHFYNPINGQGLSGAFSGLPSIIWGLETTDIAGQDYSYKDARNYFYRGLTGPSKADREANFALTFRTLGDVIHLIQDAAQPQHTRNDSHGAYSYYEKFTGSLNIRPNLPLLDYIPVYPGTDPTIFNDPRNFWHTGPNSPAGVLTGKGMADFSNRGFVTAGTNFIGTAANIRPDPRFPYPDGSGVELEKKQITDLTLLGPKSPNQPMVGEIWFIRTAVTDTYRGDPVTSRTSTFSIFDDDLSQYGGDAVFSLNRFNFLDAHKLLIPRAVGFSAGLINYFFRGQMEVGLPDDGVYAIVDHAPDDTTRAGCGTPCGFRKIKLRLKNTTPSDDMGAGTLVVIAKFNTNICYQPNLSGEYGAPGFTGAACRPFGESIVVSNPKNVDSVDRDARALEFTFPGATPIPINAIDLYLQVVYRGKLGEENDAVAVTTIDLREPTYLFFGNHTDYQAVYNNDGSFSSATAVSAEAFNIEVRFNPDRSNPTASSTPLQTGHFHRIAILSDKDTIDFWLFEHEISGSSSTNKWSFNATVNQTDARDQTRNFPSYVTLRRTTETEWAYMPNLPGAVIYWIWGYSCVDRTTNCQPVDKTDDARARRYPPFQQSTPTPMVIDF